MIDILCINIYKHILNVQTSHHVKEISRYVWCDELLIIFKISLKNLEKADSEDSQLRRKRKSVNKQPEKYFEKYAKILGEESGLDAAKIAKSNEAYGMGKTTLD